MFYNCPVRKLASQSPPFYEKTPPHECTHGHRHTHTGRLTLTWADSHSRAQTHSHGHRLTLTRADSHSRAQTHTGAWTHTGTHGRRTGSDTPGAAARTAPAGWGSAGPGAAGRGPEPGSGQRSGLRPPPEPWARRWLQALPLAGKAQTHSGLWGGRFPQGQPRATRRPKAARLVLQVREAGARSLVRGRDGCRAGP